MSAPRRLSVEQIKFVKAMATKRRVAMAAVRAIPTNEQLAEQLHVSQRLIERVASDGYTIVLRGTFADATEGASAC